MALPSYDAGLQLVDDPLACFSTRTYRQHMTILPKYIGQLRKGITDFLDAQVKTYCADLEGVLIAYQNPRRFQSGGRIYEELPHLHLDIEVDVIVFKPEIGCTLKGFVNKIGRDHIGCLVHSCFNASISRPSHLSHGEWDGSKLALGEDFMFTVTKIVDHSDQVFMRGKILQDSIPDPATKKKTLKRKLSEDYPVTEEDSQESSPKRHKHKKKKSKDTSEYSTPPRSKKGPGLSLDVIVDKALHTVTSYSECSPTSSSLDVSNMDANTPEINIMPHTLGFGQCPSSDSGVSSSLSNTDFVKPHRKKVKKEKRREHGSIDGNESTPRRHKHKHKVKEKTFS